MPSFTHRTHVPPFMCVVQPWSMHTPTLPTHPAPATIATPSPSATSAYESRGARRDTYTRDGRTSRVWGTNRGNRILYPKDGGLPQDAACTTQLDGGKIVTL